MVGTGLGNQRIFQTGTRRTQEGKLQEDENVIVGQSGGPTAVINASLYGVIREALKSEEVGHVYGMINGIEGFLQDKYMDLGEELSEGELELLKLTPAPTWFMPLQTAGRSVSSFLSDDF